MGSRTWKRSRGPPAARAARRRAWFERAAASVNKPPLSVQTAEGLAVYAHARIRAELGAGPDRDKRYSWGYPSCPDLAQHEIVDWLIHVGEAGIRITEGFQFDPEQTAAALAVLHPDARYFALALSGGDAANA